MVSQPIETRSIGIGYLNGKTSVSIYQVRWYGHLWYLDPRRYGQLELSISMATHPTEYPNVAGTSSIGGVIDGDVRLAISSLSDNQLYQSVIKPLT